ncbi:MAG TPA: TfoX/Sxy family protein [Actinomycetes bacterium]|nr:TfoX/Sxy family protein [Actinomycetes bacterium]
MAYDEGLATRIRELIGGESGLAEKKMFGGLAFLLNGNMACGVHGDDLIVRTDPTVYETSLSESGVRPFDLTGRPMKGWILVDTSGHGEDDDLRRWVDRGVGYARSLPPK